MIVTKLNTLELEIDIYAIHLSQYESIKSIFLGHLLVDYTIQMAKCRKWL